MLDVIRFSHITLFLINLIGRGPFRNTIQDGLGVAKDSWRHSSFSLEYLGGWFFIMVWQLRINYIALALLIYVVWLSIKQKQLSILCGIARLPEFLGIYCY
jgi:hypothetical protein